MLPAIAPGEPIVVDCGREPAIGEVAVFRFAGHVGVHRVVARLGTRMVTWGDANALPDEPIATDDLIGTVQEAPGARRSMARAMLLRLVLARGADAERAARRIRRLHGAREAWRDGPGSFMRKGWRALTRGPSW